MNGHEVGVTRFTGTNKDVTAKTKSAVNSTTRLISTCPYIFVLNLMTTNGQGRHCCTLDDTAKPLTSQVFVLRPLTLE